MNVEMRLRQRIDELADQREEQAILLADQAMTIQDQHAHVRELQRKVRDLTQQRAKWKTRALAAEWALEQQAQRRRFRHTPTNPLQGGPTMSLVTSEAEEPTTEPEPVEAEPEEAGDETEEGEEQ